MKPCRILISGHARRLAVAMLLACGIAHNAQTQETNFNFQAIFESAQNHDAKAQFELGRRYTQGDGVSRDYAKAVEYLNQSAAQGYAPAQTGLGSCYAHGLGVKQDYVTALEWYRKAAAQGNPLAQYSMGYAFAYGKGMPTNIEEAIKWWEKAGEQGQKYAQNALGQFYFHGAYPGDTNHINYQASATWLLKAGNQGYVPAMNNLGFLYQYGWGVGQDLTEAGKWYRYAAEHDDSNAQASLGLMYESGQGGLPHDKVQAYKWFLLSSDQGNAEGRHDVFEFQSHQAITPDQIAEAEHLAAEFRAKHRTNQLQADSTGSLR